MTKILVVRKLSWVPFVKLSPMENILLAIFPGVMGMFVIWLMSSVSSNYATSPVHAKHPSRNSLSRTKNEFISRSKLLADSWNDRGDARGWFTMCGVVIFMFTFRQCANEFMKSGRIISTELFSYLNKAYIKDSPDFLLAVLMQYISVFYAFLLQWFFVKVNASEKTRSVLGWTQHLWMLGMFLCSNYYVYVNKDVLTFTVRFAVVTQASVLCMKAHSYLMSNHDLWDLSRNLKKDDGESKLGVYSNRSAVFKASKDPLDYAEVLRLLRDRGIECPQKVYAANFQKHCEKSPEAHAREILEAFIALDAYRATVFPRNINLANFILFTVTPVLVYEPKYPKTESVDLFYLFTKTLETFCLQVVGWSILENFIVPSISNQSTPLWLRIVDLYVPVSGIVLILFLVVFDSILPAFAELTKFGDREFYSDWWNCTSFSEFSAKWNKPVHEFLYRHVYVESLRSSGGGFSKKNAVILTFIVSIFIHEVLITSIFGLFRPYLAVFSLFQIPLWTIMQSAVIKGRLLGNIIFWFGLLLGITIVVALYFHHYCEKANTCVLE
jgi:MBOAT, membrane-bound O-acyltransferase family